MGNEPVDLDALSAETLLGLGEPRYNALEVSELSGVPLEVSRRIWRAMGFVLIPDEQKFFTEQDLETLKELDRFMGSGFADLELVLGTTRMMSQGIGRIAEAEAEAIRIRLAEQPELIQKGLQENPSGSPIEVFESLERFLVHVWKRHLVAAINRADELLPEARTVRMAVGFADIVGFTKLSRDLEQGELAQLIESFESVAQDAATQIGGRIVKTIGDEVMFVADNALDACEMALRFIEDRPDPEPRVRIGLALGDVTPHLGDYFGPTVNLANRAAQAARPDSVLVDEAMAGELAEIAAYDMKLIPRRRVKGFGTPPLYRLRRVSVEES